MTIPVRLQRKRAKGFDLQARSLAINGLPALIVDRTTWLGNPWKISDAREAGYTGSDALIGGWCVALFREWINDEPGSLTRLYLGEVGQQRAAEIRAHLPSLRLHNLACWCGLCPAHAITGKPFDVTCPDCMPCHADVLGRLANAIVCTSETPETRP